MKDNAIEREKSRDENRQLTNFSKPLTTKL